MTHFSIIVATCLDGGIGYQNQIPWKLSADLKYFARVTQDAFKTDLPNSVIMGRKTWESIPDRFKPLKNRTNIVISRSKGTDAIYCSSLEEALSIKASHRFVIGGGQVYLEALKHPSLKYIFETKVHLNTKCDVFFHHSFERMESLEDLLGFEVKGGLENGTKYEHFLYKV